jgi:hypothetical protein
MKKLILRFKCLGRHKWKRVSTQPNGVGFLDECERCGRGRFLNFAGHASSTGSLAVEQMKEWHEVADNQS